MKKAYLIAKVELLRLAIDAFVVSVPLYWLEKPIKTVENASEYIKVWLSGAGIGRVFSETERLNYKLRDY